MQRSKVIFNSTALRNKILSNAVALQNARFIAYAEEEVQKIGTAIHQYHSRHNMDRHHNLLDSLCWGVTYHGELVGSGFYREKLATQPSYLHEWFSGDEKYLYPVNGHQLAEDYIKKYGNQGGKNGWKVFFAILAPYWGYWEKGFTLKSHFGGGSQFVQFAVMAEAYDQIRSDLRPARKYYFNSSVPKYDHAVLQKRWRRYAGF